MDKCVAYAKAHRHPEQADKTVWEMFEAARPHLVRYVGPLDGFHSVPAAVTAPSPQALISPNGGNSLIPIDRQGFYRPTIDALPGLIARGMAASEETLIRTFSNMLCLLPQPSAGCRWGHLADWLWRVIKNYQNQKAR